MTHIEVRAPANEEGTKATLVRWCKATGEPISKDEPLLEIETDKVSVEIASPATGELVEILKQPDEDVQPGELLARIAVAAAGGATDSTLAAEPLEAAAEGGIAESELQPSAGQGQGRGRGQLSPAVRRLLAERALRPEDVSGSGREGRITAADVARQAPAARSTNATPPAAATATGSSRVPHTPIRRRVAEHLVRSLEAAPHVTTVFEADLTRVQAHRAEHAAACERRGIRLTLTAYVVAACARALAAHPAINATYREDGLELHPDANIGVGTALGNDGLIVPVIQAAQRQELEEIAASLGRLVAAARAGRLTRDETRGGTFTISNHGVSGSLLAAPIIIHQPQVAILGVGKVERRVCVVQSGGAEAIAIRSLCYLTLTIDHRALDAFQANAFLAQVVATLEGWGVTG